MVRGLLLDFYGTVVEDDDALVAAIAARVAAGASTPVTAEAVAAAWMREYTTVAEGPPFRLLRDSAPESLARVMAEVGCPGDPAALYAAETARWGPPALRPGTREFLAGLRLPVCVVSDADRADLAAVVAHHGLTFTAVVTSEDVRAYKPDGAMFRRALAALGLAADEVLHVGDSLRTDVEGAHAAGIRAVWVNRHGTPAPAGAPVSHEITDLTGLAAIIR
ncbi:HAD family hydrolase [Micromonospora halophytica]|uniref:2-haloacid dehalogenase n=1 Tax=Micromonospora halophytica TaxID=47864 RepID=A0A1C5IER9_9ACTN|nr:HAD family hydrolase [Micromonospora halophytica]SCG56870.1 2-haloacid dehalogenase [Micromonospora halophytica]